MVPAILLLLLVQPQEPNRDSIIQEDIRKAVENLSSEEYWDAALARQELLSLGRAAVPALIEAFEKSRTATRADETGVRVRYYVCDILGEVRADTDRAVNILIESLQDGARFGTTAVATAAAGSLGKLGAHKAIDPLIQALDSKIAKRDGIFLGECIVALGDLRALQAEAPLLKALEGDRLTSEEQPERDRARAIPCIAAEALGKIRARNAVAALVKRIDDGLTDPLSGEAIQTFVIEAIRRILPEQKEKTDEEVGRWARDEKARLLREESVREATAKKKSTLDTYAKIGQALAAFKTKNGKLPGSLRELIPDSIASVDDLKDPWGKEIDFKAPGTGGAEYDLVSLGADGRMGGGGLDSDIWNHDLWEAGKTEETRKLIVKVADASARYKADQGTLPFRIADLFDKAPGVKNWPEGGYLPDLKREFTDPYGAPLIYRRQASNEKPFEIKSLGLDRLSGGEGINADISIWDLDWKAPDK